MFRINSNSFPLESIPSHSHGQLLNILSHSIWPPSVTVLFLQFLGHARSFLPQDTLYKPFPLLRLMFSTLFQRVGIFLHFWSWVLCHFFKEAISGTLHKQLKKKQFKKMCFPHWAERAPILMDHLFLQPPYENTLICFLQSHSHYLKLPCFPSRRRQ